MLELSLPCITCGVSVLLSMGLSSPKWRELWMCLRQWKHCILRSQAVCNWTLDGLSTNPKTIVAATNLLLVVQRRCENRQLWHVKNRKWTCMDIYSQSWLQVMLSVHGYGYMCCVYSLIIFQWHGESLLGFQCLKHIHDPLCFAVLNPIYKSAENHCVLRSQAVCPHW